VVSSSLVRSLLVAVSVLVRGGHGAHTQWSLVAVSMLGCGSLLSTVWHSCVVSSRAGSALVGDGF
jgi:hypothetical protein